MRKWPGSRAEFDDSKKPQIWHLIKPVSETVNNNAECGVRNKWHLIKPSLARVNNWILTLSDPKIRGQEPKTPRGSRLLTLSRDLLTWTACTGMKVSDFCVLAVPGTRTEWSEIKDRVDLAAVATNLLGPAAKRQGPRLLWEASDASAIIGDHSSMPSTVRSTASPGGRMILRRTRLRRVFIVSR